jgi:hypothetical protein
LPDASATANAKADFPEAVGPTKATTPGDDASIGGAESAGNDRDADAVSGRCGDLDELSEQVMAGGSCHPHLGKRSDGNPPSFNRLEVNQFILPGAAGDD